MTRFAYLCIGLFAFLLIGAACEGGDDEELDAFCQAAANAIQTTGGDASPEELTEAMDEVAETAPEEIADKAQALADETRAVFQGETEDLSEMEKLETEVATYAQENCPNQ